MHKYKIGLEVHIQLDTEYKLFSGAKNIFTNDANSNLDYFDIALPGTYPRINSEAIEKAYLLAVLFKSKKIPKFLIFDRKHYYYLDLPYGYQITQYEKPICVEGVYELPSGKKIRILNAHIECDAGKLKRYGDKLHIDYNRCGIPLVEVVTDCVFYNYETVAEFLTLLANDLKINKISLAKLEQGNLRVDVNISRIIRTEKNNINNSENTREITTCRYEIKNLSSLKDIKKAIKFSEEKLINATEDCNDMTFHYDDNFIIPSREKQSSDQYMYLYEHSLYPIPIDNFIQKAKNYTPKYTLHYINNIKKQISDISNNIIAMFVCNNDLKQLLEKILSSNCSVNSKYTCIYFLLENKLLFNEFEDNKNKLHQLFCQAFLILQNKKAAKVNISVSIREIIEKDLETNLENFLDNKGQLIKQVYIDEQLVKDFICINFGTIEKFKQCDEKALNFMVGYCIKKIQGASYVIVKEILNKIKNT